MNTSFRFVLAHMVPIVFTFNKNYEVNFCLNNATFKKQDAGKADSRQKRKRIWMDKLVKDDDLHYFFSL